MKPVVVSVRRPCTCGASRWFLCADDCPTWEIVAEYDCAPFGPDDPTMPSPDHVAQIERLHPGCAYLYLKYGDTFDTYLAQARKRLAAQAVEVPRG